MASEPEKVSPETGSQEKEQSPGPSQEKSKSATVIQNTALFGQSSSFGGAGSLFGAASAAGGLGIGMGPVSPPAESDPYNFDIDLTKVQTAQKPTKTYEDLT